MMSHALVASLTSHEHSDYIGKALSQFQQVFSHHKHDRVLLLQDGFGFPWLNSLTNLATCQRQGLRRFRTEASTQFEAGFETRLAFDAPSSEGKTVNQMAAQWLVAYSDSVTIVWDGDETTEEGLFIRQLLDMSIAARLVITWINPSTQSMLLLTGKSVSDIQLSRLALGYLSTELLQPWFNVWDAANWKASIDEVKSALAGIEGEESNTQALRSMSSIKKQVVRQLSHSHYKPQLNWFERMAGYSEKLLFSTIALDKNYWKTQKYKKAVSPSDGVYYGPFDGNDHQLIQATSKLDHHFKTHDQRATLSANRQRSAYWWIALFNFSAVVLSLFGAGIEWVLIVMAMGMGKIAGELHWSKHWLDSRSLAETIRYTRMLLPLLSTCRYQQHPLWLSNHVKKEQEKWQASPDFQARAFIREQGWPQAIDKGIYHPLQHLEAIKAYVLASLDSQLTYHRLNHEKQKNMIKHVGWLGATFGVFATFLSLAQNIPELKSDIAGNIVTFLPALIGMLQGILSQIEASRLSQQSEATMLYLTNQITLINSIDETDDWKRYNLLRKIAQDSAETLITENQGWKRLLSSR